jgi:sulfur-oxidizing protein SoxB
MDRREFLQVIAAASAAGLALDAPNALAAELSEKFYDLPRFGNVHLLHLSDCHAQLLPLWYREPSLNIGVGMAAGKPPHLVGEHLLHAFGIVPGTAQAYAFTHLDFAQAAKAYGKVGGFAHLATLVRQLRANRPDALLLDGGDTWQGTATALWTKGQDMVDASKLLGVDMMSAHWEFTLGAERVRQIVDHDLAGKIEFLAGNIRTADFGDAVFKPYAMREMNGVSVAVIGQAFPYTPIANPRYLIPDWTFGIREEEMQQTVDAVRVKGARVVVLLSHNGIDVDLKMASRVSGIDVILGGHTHDAVPAPVTVNNRGGQTLVTNAGCNGKFLGVLDFDVRDGRIRDFRYKLLPVFANLLQPDPAMTALIERVRAPYLGKLDEKLAVSADLLYRRGNFNGSWDQLILDAMLAVQGAEIGFSPGFRWGTTILPGQAITMEQLLAQTAITYPQTTLTEMSGATIKDTLEDIADNLFNPDPYKQQGGDMVRVGGMSYSCAPAATIGQRIGDMRLNGKAIEADKTYKVAGWASVSEAARDYGGEPICDMVARYLRDQKTIAPRRLNQPKLIGVAGNLGIG